jgi:hypothetical protein
MTHLQINPTSTGMVCRADNPSISDLVFLVTARALSKPTHHPDHQDFLYVDMTPAYQEG